MLNGISGLANSRRHVTGSDDLVRTKAGLGICLFLCFHGIDLDDGPLSFRYFSSENHRSYQNPLTEKHPWRFLQLFCYKQQSPPNGQHRLVVQVMSTHHPQNDQIFSHGEMNLECTWQLEQHCHRPSFLLLLLREVAAAPRPPSSLLGLL